MMYEIVHTAPDFTLKSMSLGRFPLIINSQDDSDFHFEAAREYFLYRAFKKHIDSEAIRDEASIICKFLNYMSVFENGVIKPRNWKECTVDTILNYQIRLINDNQINSAQRRNKHIATIYDFYFFCETNGLICGVIGFNDSTKRRGMTYAIPVHKPDTKSKAKLAYQIDHLESVKTRQRSNINSPKKWDDAEAMAQASTGRTSKRDELMLRVVREDYLRREELAHLVIEQFEKITHEEFVYVKLLKSKFDRQKGARTVKFPKELYNELVRYVKRARKLLKKPGVNSNALFLSQKTGKKLENRSINFIFEKYGVRPHDGRSVGLTERFVELIKEGHSQQTCLEIVSTEAGHSAKSKGETLMQHYLQAEVFVTRSKSNNTNDNDALKAVQAKISELQQEIERLNRVTQ